MQKAVRSKFLGALQISLWVKVHHKPITMYWQASMLLLPSIDQRAVVASQVTVSSNNVNTCQGHSSHVRLVHRCRPRKLLQRPQVTAQQALPRYNGTIERSGLLIVYVPATCREIRQLCVSGCSESGFMGPGSGQNLVSRYIILLWPV